MVVLLIPGDYFFPRTFLKRGPMQRREKERLKMSRHPTKLDPEESRVEAINSRVTKTITKVKCNVSEHMSLFYFDYHHLSILVAKTPT